MSWRPEGWNNPNEKIVLDAVYLSAEMNTALIAKQQFEAGADAMLNALTQRSVIRTFGVRAAADSPKVKVALPNEPGVWVFIPDEDQIQHSTENG